MATWISSDKLLLVDGTSFLLLTNDTDRLLLDSGTWSPSSGVADGYINDLIDQQLSLPEVQGVTERLTLFRQLNGLTAWDDWVNFLAAQTGGFTSATDDGDDYWDG